MKHRISLAVFALNSLFAIVLRAQVAIDETAAFIQNPTGVHYVFSSNPSHPGTGVFTYVNTNSGDFDIIGVTISGSQSFQGASEKDAGVASKHLTFRRPKEEADGACLWNIDIL